MMNRFAELNAKADFGKEIKMEYASVLRMEEREKPPSSMQTA